MRYLIRWIVDGSSGLTVIHVDSDREARRYWKRYFVHAGYTLISIERG